MVRSRSVCLFVCLLDSLADTTDWLLVAAEEKGGGEGGTTRRRNRTGCERTFLCKHWLFANKLHHQLHHQQQHPPPPPSFLHLWSFTVKLHNIHSVEQHIIIEEKLLFTLTLITHWELCVCCHRVARVSLSALHNTSVITQKKNSEKLPKSWSQQNKHQAKFLYYIFEYVINPPTLNT